MSFLALATVPLKTQLRGGVRNARVPPHWNCPGSDQSVAPVAMETPTVLASSSPLEWSAFVAPAVPTSVPPKARKSQPASGLYPGPPKSWSIVFVHATVPLAESASSVGERASVRYMSRSSAVAGPCSKPTAVPVDGFRIAIAVEALPL